MSITTAPANEVVSKTVAAGCRIRRPAFVEMMSPRRGSIDLPKEPEVTKYLISFNDEWVAPHTHEELVAKSVAVSAVIAEMEEAGVFVFGDGGLDASTVVCHVEARAGEPVFTDGPYAESKEHLGGFTVVEVADDEAARYWAGRLAMALDWPQEVHRFPAPPTER